MPPSEGDVDKACWLANILAPEWNGLNQFMLSRKKSMQQTMFGLLSAAVAYLLWMSGRSGTDDVFRCTHRQWEMVVFKPGGTVTSTSHLLDIRVGALPSAYQDLLVP